MNGWSRLPCPLKENSSVELTSDKKKPQNKTATPGFFLTKASKLLGLKKNLDLGHIGSENLDLTRKST